MKHLNLLLICSILFVGKALAQPKVIWTIHGDSILVQEVKFAADTTSQEIQFLNKKSRWREIDRQEVFSINSDNNKIEYLYYPIYKEDMNLDQMKLYIEGHKHGYPGSKWQPFVIGLISGAATMAISPDNFYIAPLIPLCATIAIGKLSPRTPSPSNDIYFTEGYQKRRKLQNIKSAFLGNVSGLVIGFFGSYAIYGWGL